MNLMKLGRLALASLLTLSLMGCDSTSSTVVEETETSAGAAPAAIYVASNNAGTNSVLAYTRDTAGALTFASETPTGGSGSGTDSDSCGNSIFLDSSTELLYVVNTGSNSISLFLVNTDGTLSLLDVENTGGVNPVSVAVNFNIAYVLNAGDATNAANIKGFLISGGQFVELADGEANLSAALPGAAKIGFAPAGTVLTVTEQDTGLLSNFTLDTSLSNPTLVSTAGSGTTPAGFDYTPGGVLLVAERFADAAGAGTVSSYSVGTTGLATAITSSLALSQTGSTCVKVVSGGNHALVANFGSNNIAVVNIANDGTLSLNGDVENTGSAPNEIATSADESFVYVLNTGDDSVSILSHSSGNLTPSNTLTGLPASARGLTGR